MLALKIILSFVLLSETIHAFPFVLPEAEFVSIEDFRLSQIEQRPGLDIKYKVYQTLGERPILTIVFESLSQSQFNFVNKTYNTGESRVSFEPNRPYDLVEFLSPKIQAVMGHRFNMEGFEPNEIAANCWGTVYEIVRGGENLSVFYTSWKPMLKLYRNNAFSRHVGHAEPAATEPMLGRLAKTGDVLVYTNAKGKLDHAAIFIDQNLFFEKTGVMSDTSYRLVHGIDEVRHPRYKNHLVEIRRFGGVGKKPLIHPSKMFTENGKPIIYRDFSLEFENSSSGRARLPFSAYVRAGKSGDPTIQRTFATALNLCGLMGFGH